MFANQSLPSIQSIPTNRRVGFTTTRFPSRIAVQASSCSTATKNKPAANLYEVLRLQKSASPAEIKAAYRSLVKKFHPDTKKSASDSGDFIEIHNAYETLSDPMAKARYDLSLSLSISVGLRGGGVDGFCGHPVPDFVGRTTRRWETDQCW